MLRNTIYKWSAVCVLAGALTLGVGYLLRPNIEKELIDLFATTGALVSSIMVALGSLLLICGLPALFARQIGRTGIGGVIASGLTFSGIAAFHLGTLALYFVIPVLVRNDATRALVYSDEPPFPRFAIFWAISLLVQSAGLIWLGFKTLKAAVYPGIASILLIIGGVFFIAAPFLDFTLIKPANTLIMIAFGWSAISVLRPSADSAYRDELLAVA